MSLESNSTLPQYFLIESDNELDDKIYASYGEKKSISSTTFTESEDSTEELFPLSKQKESRDAKRKAEVLLKLFPRESNKVGRRITNTLHHDETKIPESNSSPVSLESAPILEIRTILTNPGHEYWRLKNPVIDQVSITDIQIDTNIITIRECPTEEGFFKKYEGEQDGGRCCLKNEIDTDTISRKTC